MRRKAFVFSFLLLLARVVVARDPVATVDHDGRTQKVHLDLAVQYPGLRKPAKPVVPPRPTMMIMVSAYRDGERCGKTLDHAFMQATRPNDIYFGVVDQLGPGDKSCLEWFCGIQMARLGDCRYKSHVTVTTLNYLKAAGPIYARSFQTAMIRDEDFCLQVDAHSHFSEGFDDELVRSFAATENEYAVLSTYVHDIDALGKTWAKVTVPHVCLSIMGGMSMPRNARAANGHHFPRPKLNWAWCAGMSFMKCHGELAVPNDPNLLQVFDGEEFSRGARLWTRGYDMYTPDTNTVFHDYSNKMGHAGNRAVWNFEPPPEDARKKQRESERSRKRLETLFGMDGGDGQDLGIYGLGTTRTLEQFYAFSGIDPRVQKTARGETCGDLQWVAYTHGAAPEEKKPGAHREGQKGSSKSSSLSRKAAPAAAFAPIEDVATRELRFEELATDPYSAGVDGPLVTIEDLGTREAGGATSGRTYHTGAGGFGIATKARIDASHKSATGRTALRTKVLQTKASQFILCLAVLLSIALNMYWLCFMAGTARKDAAFNV